MYSNDQFIKNCISLAKSSYFNPALDGSVLVYAETNVKDIHAFWSLSFNNDREKMLVIHAVAAAMQNRNTVRYAFMTLGWKSLISEDNSEIKPSAAPDRKEVLMISMSDNDTLNIMHYFEVVRSEDLIVNFTNEEKESGKKGTFTELLKKEFTDKAKELGDVLLNDSLLSGQPFKPEVMEILKNHPVTSIH